MLTHMGPIYIAHVVTYIQAGTHTYLNTVTIKIVTIIKILQRLGVVDNDRSMHRVNTVYSLCTSFATDGGQKDTTYLKRP